LAEYARRSGELTSLGFGLVAVSVDPAERSRAMAAQIGLPFPLLGDTGREVVRAYGVYNEEEKGGIAYPSTFVLDRDRIVRFRSLDRMRSRVDLDGLFAFLRGGIDAAAPDQPKRARVSPSLADLGRMTYNALRFGVRSPKQ
jgi:peroxiredoxin